ncbi:Hypothetical Protein RradSPS_0269 [Rubrobacter radiotolerans]|uniref:Alkaline shock response membrane anchor protein AmaP n=1 Tax=Rubrobacter radiotolerans TaxID=42256 RepID=A0A023WZD2_RUBRA|nr:hypothetical protein [Rubrobacter radiotolerans]AHY45552.1 Hypothetical Protein RradSPS_0269 [Rubrobacter radiotolerans]MDX5892965.1 hypothetical protein [Rubrobacter radiotolerans]SMC02825.1 conserved hypothetical protein [Rubrobacter radiotolerans DSM 5868]
MNGFNRFVLLVVALLLIAVPVLLLLINFGVIPADTVNQYTGYRAGLASLEGITNLNLTSTLARVITVIVGALVALIALLLLLRELTFGKVLVRNAVVDDRPGAETRLTAKAISALSDGAAREAGARDPSTSLSTKGDAYEVDCRIKVPESGNYTEIASRARANIKRVLESQSLKVRDVEVTVRGKE